MTKACIFWDGHGMYVAHPPYSNFPTFIQNKGESNQIWDLTGMSKGKKLHQTSNNLSVRADPPEMSYKIWF